MNFLLKTELTLKIFEDDITNGRTFGVINYVFLV